MTKMGRLAMRVEGTLWVAYYALPDTMDGAIFLGSIHMKFVKTQERKAAFLAMMRECVTDLFEEYGMRPSWQDPEGQETPEHERGGTG